MSKCKSQGLVIKYVFCALLAVSGILSVKASNSIVPITEKSWLYGALACSMAAGVFSSLGLYKVGMKSLQGLVYKPNQAEQSKFDKIITECGLGSFDVSICYDYIDGPCMTLFNTIIIDPSLWKGLEGDSGAGELKKKIIECVPSNWTRDRVLECISVQAQNFFLRHELDHVRSKYVSKNIMLKGASLAIATLCGFTAAFCFKKNSTTLILPIFAGFATLCATSLGLHFCSNAFWKFRAEKDADLFAAEHSTADEILAAAKYVEATTPSSPSTYWLEGYPNARTRGAYLREIAQRKQGSIIIN